MAQSHSKSPMWEYRRLSPIPRKADYYKQRYPYEYFGYDYRKDPQRPTIGSMDSNIYGQSKPRIPSRENIYYHFYEHRSPSPKMRRRALDDFHSYKPYQVYIPGREASNRRSPYSPRYSEGVHSQEYWCDYNPHQVQGKHSPDDYRVERNEKGGILPFRSLGDSFQYEGKWHEDELRYQRIQDEKYFESLRRGSEDFARSSFQKRYPEDYDCGAYGYTSKIPIVMERYENRDPSRNPQWRSRHCLLPYPERREQQDIRYQGHHQAQWRLPEASSTDRESTDYHYKRPKTSNEDREFSDGRTHKYSKEEDKKYSSQKEENRKYSFHNDPVSRESSSFHAGKGRQSKDGQVKEAVKSYKKEYTASAHSIKSGTGMRSYERKQQKKKKGKDGRREGISSNKELGERKLPNVKLSSTGLKKTLVFKLNPPRAASGRTEVQDLVDTGRKSEHLCPLYEYFDSTQNTRKKSAGEYAQEVIHVIHQVKGNYLPSCDITLHKRFSKIQEKKAADLKRKNLNPSPENLREPDVCLTQNRHVTVCKSQKTKVMDPNDLRHDIERRRKERLQAEDESIFNTDSAAERVDQSSSSSTHVNGFRKPRSDSTELAQSPRTREEEKETEKETLTEKCDVPYQRTQPTTQDYTTQREENTTLQPHGVEKNTENSTTFKGDRLQPRYTISLAREGYNAESKDEHLQSSDSRELNTEREKPQQERKEYTDVAIEV